MKSLLSLPESAMTRNRFVFHPREDKWFIADLSQNIYLKFKPFVPYCDPVLIIAFKKTLVFYRN